MVDKRSVEDEELASIMRLSDGRKFVHRLIVQAGTNTDTFNVEPHIHAYNAGRRSIGTWLVDEVRNTCPDQYITMIKEHTDD